LEICVRTITEIIVYPDIEQILEKKIDWFCESIIVTPKNETAEEINEIILKKSSTASILIYLTGYIDNFISFFVIC